MKSKAAVRRIVEALKTLYPDALCSLQYQKDYELLFAVRNDDFRIGFITHEGHLQFFCKCLFVERRVQTHRIYAGDLAAARVDADAAHRSLGLRRQQSGQTAGPVERRRLRLVKRQPDAGHKQAHSLSSPFSPVQSEEPLSAPPEPSPVI